MAGSPPRASNRSGSSSRSASIRSTWRPLPGSERADVARMRFHPVNASAAALSGGFGVVGGVLGVLDRMDEEWEGNGRDACQLASHRVLVGGGEQLVLAHRVDVAPAPFQGGAEPHRRA